MVVITDFEQGVFLVTFILFWKTCGAFFLLRIIGDFCSSPELFLSPLLLKITFTGFLFEPEGPGIWKWVLIDEVGLMGEKALKEEKIPMLNLYKNFSEFLLWKSISSR